MKSVYCAVRAGFSYKSDDIFLEGLCSMEEFEFAGFSIVTVEVSILLGYDSGSLGDPYPKFPLIFKA
jgi:hypothetical protein